MLDHRRIKFFSVSDLSSSLQLQRIESFFKDWTGKIAVLDINIILELYNIKRYIDAGMRLEKWTDEQFSKYQAKCKLIPEILGRFFNSISDANFKSHYQLVCLQYFDDFWQLICRFKVYKRIEPSTIENLMDNMESTVWYIMQHNVLVEFFGQSISDQLIQNSMTPEQLIMHYLAKPENTDKPLYFPKEFTQELRTKTIIKYIESEEANSNYLQLLEQVQSTKEFPISDRLKLKARKKSEDVREKFFEKSHKFSYGVEISFKSIPDGSTKEFYKDNIIFYIYSQEWIEDNLDYPTLLNNFIYLFQFVDLQFRCTFVSLKSEIWALEQIIGIRGKKEYEKGIIFRIKQIRSSLQIAAYIKKLQQLHIRLEDIFKWFFENYLKDEFNAIGFSYNPPSIGTTYGEKCKLLAIAIDGVLKQYRLFCEDGFVNRELLEISSGYVVFSEISSVIKNKYAYKSSEALQSEMFLLFSDQSIMNYTEKTASKYQTLMQLLMSEKMERNDFACYQLNSLDWLIERGAIYITEDGCLKLNEVRALVLRDLFKNEVICPIYYNDEKFKQQIIMLVSVGDIYYESTLFSKPEQEYLNYILNKSKFSNGLDLRNKYCHDTYSLNEKVQFQDYLELLKIMI